VLSVVGKGNGEKLMELVGDVRQDDGGQEYELLSVLWICKGCGAVIGDTPQHDKMHMKTRSSV
jgi:hypothetical protein